MIGKEITFSYRKALKFTFADSILNLVI